MNDLIRKLKGKGRASSLDVFAVMVICSFAVIMLIIYFTSLGAQSWVRDRCQAITQEYKDNVARYGVITPAMQREYKKRYDAYKFFVHDYSIKYEVSNYENSGRTFVKKGTYMSDNGNTISEIKLDSGDTFRIVMYSKTNNALGYFLSKVTGKNPDTDIVSKTAVSSGGVMLNGRHS